MVDNELIMADFLGWIWLTRPGKHIEIAIENGYRNSGFSHSYVNVYQKVTQQFERLRPLQNFPGRNQSFTTSPIIKINQSFIV